MIQQGICLLPNSDLQQCSLFDRYQGKKINTGTARGGRANREALRPHRAVPPTLLTAADEVIE
jgi:hypothetical protein